MQKPPSLHHHHSFLQFPCSMSSSASFMPQQVEPPTTIQTKSSFSEIEPIQEPSLYHLTLSDPSFISSSLYTPQSIEPFISPLTETNLNYHKSTFSSSLEAKQHHVESFIRNQRAILQQEQELQRKTKAEIQSLIPLDTRSLDEELILDDSHQQWADLLLSSTTTASRKRFSFSSLPSPTSDRRRSTALVHSWLSNIVDYKGYETTDNTSFGIEESPSPHRISSNGNNDSRRSSTKLWLKSLTRWIPFGQGNKKRDKVDQDNDDNYQQQHRQQSPLSLATMTATAIEEDKLRHETMVDSTLDDEYDKRRHRSKKAARHVSWSMGTSFEEYKLGKSRQREQDYYDNGTLDDSQRPHLFLPTRNVSAAAYMDDPPLPPIPTLMTTNSFLPHSAPTSPTSPTHHQQKKGFGFSFVQHSLTSTTRSLLHPQKSLSRRRKRKVYHIDPSQVPPLNDNDDDHDGYMDGDNINATPTTIMDQRYSYYRQQQQPPLPKKDTHRRRYSSSHLIDRYSPRLSALKEEADVAANRQQQQLVAFRYPRMVRMKNLMHSYMVATHPVEADYDDLLNDNEGRYLGSGNWISSRHFHNYHTGAEDQYDNNRALFFGGMENDSGDDIENEDDNDDDDNSLVKYSRQYRNSSKRFSDPGAGLSAPPFPIGRPLASFYD